MTKIARHIEIIIRLPLQAGPAAVPAPQIVLQIRRRIHIHT